MISRDGKYLMVVNGVPEYTIKIWDLEKQLPLGELEIRTDYTLLDASFSAKDNTLIAVLYEESLQIGQMKPILKERQSEFVNYNRIEVHEYPSTHNKCMLWNEINLLYLCSEEKI